MYYVNGMLKVLFQVILHQNAILHVNSIALGYSAVSDDVVVADDDGAGFHDQHQNDAKSAVVAPF